jgi:N-acetylmuramoyl-L-alanine amidase
MTNFEMVKERLIPVSNFTNFNDVVCEKKSIVLHHTAGGSASSSVSFWKQQINKVATCVVIDRDGSILQCFPSDRWAYSLGLQTANYQTIEKQTIAIEIASYGYLNKSRGDYYNAYTGYMPMDKVYEFDAPFKGKMAYEKYTEQQVESVRRLLLYWHEKYGIDIKYKGDKIFDLCPDAIKGEGGVWTHNSFRADKSDICPQKNIVDMLKSL